MGKRKRTDGGPERERTEVDVVQTPVPRTPGELAEYVRTVMGTRIASRALLEGNDGPLAYLAHAFFEGRFVLGPDGAWTDLADGARPPGDCVVWANRGGGKTYLGAVATALDMVFKPGIEVRILGGSAEQSRRMHEHLRAIFERDGLKELLDGRTTESRVRLVNGSRVEVLAHSERSVRGVRVQKLRCDEVDLFDKDLWQAAQLVTRSSSPTPGPWGNRVRGVVEVLSTMHVPGGLMQEIVACSQRAAAPGAAGAGAAVAPCASAHGSSVGHGPMAAPRVLFKWGVVDSLEPCGPEHACAGCALWAECGGRAKASGEGGHMTVRDAQTLKGRVSRATWETEMLCREPSRTGCVYPEFSRAAHVTASDATDAEGATVVAGMDFGVRSPTVVVWGVLRTDGVLEVIDEYAQPDRRLGEHVLAITSRRWGPPAWIGIDPAGNARNEQTGQSNAKAMRHAGLVVRARREPLAQGVEAVRALLAPAHGPARLRINPRCVGLIDALGRYRYPPDRPDDPSPEKDGSDHWCDALRYLVVNLQLRTVGVGNWG